VAQPPTRLRTECLDLADFALTDEPRRLRDRATELARVIQETIDDWIESKRDEEQ
jgi:hypothetical protein